MWVTTITGGSLQPGVKYKNSGLKTLFTEKFGGPYEILCIDYGSPGPGSSTAIEVNAEEDDADRLESSSDRSERNSPAISERLDVRDLLLDETE